MGAVYVDRPGDGPIDSIVIVSLCAIKKSHV
jgi:hypothetical protein